MPAVLGLALVLFALGLVVAGIFASGRFLPSSPNRPARLPGTNLAGAFGSITPPATLVEKARGHPGLVVLDPGHGGSKIGASSAFPGLPPLVEKDLNLKVALKTAELLRQAGKTVELTRTTDSQVNNPPKDLTGDGKVNLDDDLEARVDFANNAGATLFLSIHFNGNSDQGLNGATVYYDDARAFRVKNAEFARMVLDNLLLATGARGTSWPAVGSRRTNRRWGRATTFTFWVLRARRSHGLRGWWGLLPREPS